MLVGLNYHQRDFYVNLNELLNRGKQEAENVDEVVQSIIAKVRSQGDQALLDFTRKFDSRTMDVGDLELSDLQIDSIARQIDLELKQALNVAAERIRWFHEKERLASWECMDEDGTQLGQSISAIDRVGVYVPGGTAAYPSSVLMTTIPARVAGVSEIIMVVPMPKGEVNPAVIAAAQIAGVDRIFTVGGAQAVAALAYGTESIPAVDKIVGPGNAYVATAKKQVFGKVGIDMIAGPSEVLVIADSSADPEWVAMDMFAQAEHDEMAQSIAIVTDPKLREAINVAIDKLLPGLERRNIIEASLTANGALIQVENLTEAVEVANHIAPEHLELMVSNPQEVVSKIRHAGAIFVGKNSAEVLGDYCAGPNHVLPTSGTARFSSPLGVYDFQKRSSIVNLSPDGARKLSRIAATLAHSEGLTAHERSAEYRADSAKNPAPSVHHMAKQHVQRWVPDQIRSMSEYRVSDSAGLVKLDAMENPFSLPESLTNEWREALNQVSVNRYPDADCRKLKESLIRYVGLPEACSMVLGNGSDELLQMLIMLLGGRGRTIIAPSPSFSMYQQICLYTSTRFIGVPLAKDFSLHGEEMIRAIRQYNPACIFIAYPNNPTGNLFDTNVIEEILEVANGLVVIDEAYHAFSNSSYLSEVPNRPNLVVIRTLSKTGLAGLRLGLAIANNEWGKEISKVRFPYNINSLTQLSASLILDNADLLKEQADSIIQERKKQFEALQTIDGVTVFPSAANFHLFRVSDADRVYRELLNHGVLIKNLHGTDDQLDQCLRVTVGTPEENWQFLATLQNILVP